MSGARLVVLDQCVGAAARTGRGKNYYIHFVYIYIYIHIYTYMYIYIYIHTHTHPHTHIYIYINRARLGSTPISESGSNNRIVALLILCVGARADGCALLRRHHLGLGGSPESLRCLFSTGPG